MKNIKLSIIILSFNTQELTIDCLSSLKSLENEIPFEVIVVDNNSSDESVEKIKKFKFAKSKLKLIESSKNVGFGRGNNLAKDVVKGEFVLLLNSDTVVKGGTLGSTVKYLKENSEVGVVTCKMILPDGSLDKDARRSFPTPWVSLTHLVLHLDKLFPKSKIFSKYWYGYKSPDEIHDIDVAQGAFFLTTKKTLDDVGWFDEEYFLDGEDIDLSWKIKKTGKRIMYFPKAEIIHIKKASKHKSSIDDRKKFVASGMDSMELFYRKRLWKSYPIYLNTIVVVGIRIIKYYRILRISIN